MLEAEFKAKLKDGTQVLIRTIDPCDKKCISAGFSRFSPRSRYLRFFSPINQLTDGQLTYLTDIDNVNHVLIAATEVAEKGSAGIGLARYIRLKQEPDVAEFAISVADDYQGRGAGSLLLDLLIEHAKSNQVRILRGYVLTANQLMIKLLEGRGTQGIVDQDGSLRFDILVDS